MATWITHLMIADTVLRDCPELDRHGFCVGNIAPDCNVENTDWTSFTPSREITHWMQGSQKVAADCDCFYRDYIAARRDRIRSHEEASFLLGYYSHLITDAEFQRFICDGERVRAAWARLMANKHLRECATGLPISWNSIKKVISKEERIHEIYAMEAEYLRDHPDSGYLTEILPLTEFPDYIDYLPHGSIVRKIGVMGTVPQVDEALDPISMSRSELQHFAQSTAALVVRLLKEKSPLITMYKCK